MYLRRCVCVCGVCVFDAYVASNKLRGKHFYLYACKVGINWKASRRCGVILAYATWTRVMCLHCVLFMRAGCVGWASSKTKHVCRGRLASGTMRHRQWHPKNVPSVFVSASDRVRVLLWYCCLILNALSWAIFSGPKFIHSLLFCQREKYSDA